MAETARSVRARARSVPAAAAVLLAVVGLFLVWDGSRAPHEGTGPGARRAAVAVPDDPSPVAATSSVAAPRRGVVPDAVVLPALGVRADVLPIRTQGGALTPPADPLQVGWWSGGARPGADHGAAVLTGHTVHTGGGALDDLENLVAGDRVLVRSGRASVAFRVTSVRILSKAELARESVDVFGRGGPGRLVLITCEDWDGSGYRSNVVVTARPRP